MNGILIQYEYSGDEAKWERAFTKFIEHIDNDPKLKGKFSYIVSRVKEGSKKVHRGNSER